MLKHSQTIVPRRSPVEGHARLKSHTAGPRRNGDWNCRTAPRRGLTGSSAVPPLGAPAGSPAAITVTMGAAGVDCSPPGARLEAPPHRTRV
eukprot:4741726-Pyramimonas_sp.AAC.1